MHFAVVNTRDRFGSEIVRVRDAQDAPADTGVTLAKPFSSKVFESANHVLDDAITVVHHRGADLRSSRRAAA